MGGLMVPAAGPQAPQLETLIYSALRSNKGNGYPGSSSISARYLSYRRLSLHFFAKSTPYFRSPRSLRFSLQSSRPSTRRTSGVGTARPERRIMNNAVPQEVADF